MLFFYSFLGLVQASTHDPHAPRTATHPERISGHDPWKNQICQNGRGSGCPCGTASPRPARFRRRFARARGTSGRPRWLNCVTEPEQTSTPPHHQLFPRCPPRKKPRRTSFKKKASLKEYEMQLLGPLERAAPENWRTRHALAAWWTLRQAIRRGLVADRSAGSGTRRVEDRGLAQRPQQFAAVRPGSHWKRFRQLSASCAQQRTCRVHPAGRQTPLSWAAAVPTRIILTTTLKPYPQVPDPPIAKPGRLKGLHPCQLSKPPPGYGSTRGCFPCRSLPKVFLPDRW